MIIILAAVAVVGVEWLDEVQNYRQKYQEKGHLEKDYWRMKQEKVQETSLTLFRMTCLCDYQ